MLREQIKEIKYEKPLKIKKEPLFRAVLYIGRGTKIRTQKNGFGDRYVTITSCPCVQMGL